MTTDEKIGLKLRQLREAHDYSLEDLAKLTGKHRSTIHLYEIGKVAVSIKMLRIILEVYGESYTKFLNEIE